MRFAFSFIILLNFLLLTGCSSAVSDINSDSGVLDSGAVATSKRPRIPESRDLKASVLDHDRPRTPDETALLLEAIERKIDQPNILYEDIQRGWYYGALDEKKAGTPTTWVWAEEGKRSRWISPNAIEVAVTVKAEDLCKKTAGTYILSCIEADSATCEYVPANTCKCIEGSAWNEVQGCILTDEMGAFVGIADAELKRGWYAGLPNQKKLDTPGNWVWVDAGENSRWQNPSPLN